MAATYLGGQGTGAGSGSTLAPARPAAAVRGCVLLMTQYLESPSATIVTPAGWTPLTNPREDSSQLAVWGIEDTGAAGPYSLTWGGASVYRDAWVGAYAGVTLAGAVAAGQANAASRSMTALGVTTPSDNCALVLLGAGNGAAGGITAPAGMTERADRAGTYSADLLDAGAAGATGNRTATMGNSIQSLAALVALPLLPVDGATIAHYNGSSWDDCPLHLYDGAAWAQAAGLAVM